MATPAARLAGLARRCAAHAPASWAPHGAASTLARGPAMPVRYGGPERQFSLAAAGGARALAPFPGGFAYHSSLGSVEEAVRRGAPLHRAFSSAAGAGGGEGGVVGRGDIIKVHYTGYMEDESTFDSSREKGGGIEFTVGRREVVEGFDDGVVGMALGETRTFTLTPEQGYGAHDPNLVIPIPRSRAPEGVGLGSTVRISTGATAYVVAADEDEVVIDANHPLAGETLKYEVELLELISGANLEEATFGMGCFWGPELAFQRVPGVIKTCVGYSNGHVPSPSYSQVCHGDTGHAEVVQIRFDPKQVSYEKLLGEFLRHHDPTQVDRQGADVGTAYRSAIFYNSPEQKAAAKAAVAEEGARRHPLPIATEITAIANFYLAEEEHQQYLVKGGRFGNAQSAAKGCKEEIRCYG